MHIVKPPSSPFSNDKCNHRVCPCCTLSGSHVIQPLNYQIVYLHNLNSNHVVQLLGELQAQNTNQYQTSLPYHHTIPELAFEPQPHDRCGLSCPKARLSRRGFHREAWARAFPDDGQVLPGGCRTTALGGGCGCSGRESASEELGDCLTA